MSQFPCRAITVDLSSGTVTTEEIPGSYYRKFCGGYGLGAAILLERMDPSADPLGPDNLLGFAAGYLTGTGAYIGSRFMVFGKSPSTGGWGDSNCGGYFGKGMRQSGADLLLFSGSAANPVYVLIDVGNVSIHSAGDLWGRDTYETEAFLKDCHGNSAQVACIGQAGERLSMIAGISTDRGRFAARSALGAVMGSKLLKAVVVKGSLPVPCAHPDMVSELRREYRSRFKEDFPATLSRYGTPMFYHSSLLAGDTPVRNWGGSAVDLKVSKLDEAETVLGYQKRKYGCQGCPVACGGHVEIEEGLYKTAGPVHKVEYETMGMFGANLLNDNIESLIRINDLCNRFGMDTIGCGGLVAFATECFARGIISEGDTDGLRLEWSDPPGIVKLVELIGSGEGLGEILSKGFEYAVERFGPESRSLAIAVRNEGLPAHDPRWSADLALTYYSDATPARHTQGCTTFPVAGYVMPDATGGSLPVNVQAKAHRDNVNLYHALSSLGLCLFGFSILDHSVIPRFLKAVDGDEWTVAELDAAGERIHLLRHLFNLKAGVRFTDHEFPGRVLGNPPLKEGATAGVSLDLEAMTGEYMSIYHLETDGGLAPEEDHLSRCGILEYR